MKRTSLLALASLSFFPTVWISAQDAKSSLPEDVYPDSRNRLPLIKREDVDERAKKTYDAAVASFAGAVPAMGAAIRLHGNPLNKATIRHLTQRLYLAYS
jgi:hypothetical protein